MLLKQISVVALAAAAFVGITGCGSEADPVEQVVEPAVTRIEQGIDAIDRADTLACQTDKMTLEAAIEAYTTLEGEPPPDEAALVPTYLREESELYDIAGGQVVPAATSSCP